MVLSSFTCTSDKSYDRHSYEVVLKDQKSLLFDNWEDTQVYWWQHCQIPDFLDFVIVKDKRKINKKGFGQ